MITNMKKIATIIAIVAIAAVACKKETPKDPDALSLDKTEITAEAAGSTATVKVTANCPWEAVTTADWVKITPASGEGDGSFSVEISANDGEARQATITVLGGNSRDLDQDGRPDNSDCTATISVSQGEAASNITFGTCTFGGALYVGDASTAYVEVPYIGSNGRESIEFELTVTDGVSGTGASAGIESTKYTCTQFQKGTGSVKVAFSGTPTTFGLVKIDVKTGTEVLAEAIETRVEEKLSYKNYVCWNPWAKGYTRADYCYMAGSAYDKSWTTKGTDAAKVASTNASDHIVLPTHVSSDEYAAAYLTVVAANPITAAGTYELPKTAGSLGGFTFNPGIQCQGMVKDDYFVAAIPVKSLPAGSVVSIASSFGGAANAVGYFLLEFSLDGTNWFEVPGAKTISVDGTDYKYHYCDAGSTDKDFRYRYAKNAETDPNYAVYAMPTPAAISNATVYVRLRANGLNGNGVVQTKTGWSDMKFLEISF